MPEREPRLYPYARVPQELRKQPQWVVWRKEETRKVPVNPATLGNAGVTWPETWAAFDHAVQIATCHDLGLGFVLTEEDPYTCVDLDRCVDQEGQVTAQTRAILDLLAGWVELSPSGTGLHIWVRGQASVNRRTPGIEVYSSARWMSVTGRSNPQAPQEIPERTAELAELLWTFFPQRSRPLPASDPSPPMPFVNDSAIWDRLFNSRNGEFFRALFTGDTSVCYGDHSRAVILLANQLALMTDGDAGAIQRLLYQTGLVRAKWDEKRGSVSWIEYQIQDAIAFVTGRGR